MKTILVPMEPHDAIPSVLRTALLLGQSFGSYIEGVAVGPDISQVLAVDIPVVAPSILDDATRRDIAARSRQQFERFMNEHGVSERFEEPNGLSFGWHADAMQSDPLVASHARVFDVTVLGRPGQRGDTPRMMTLEEILFESGRPILVAPPEPPQGLGRCILIAWNASLETARAVAFAMPLLVRSARVIVLSVEGGMVPGPTGQQLARSLRVHGIPAQAVDARHEGRATGEVILRNARDMGADLVVKGAYTQSRLRQMIFGGATRHLLEHAPLPLLMAH
jgi:nucleotide-binding universal stress UspA family protein